MRIKITRGNKVWHIAPPENEHLLKILKGCKIDYEK